MIKSMLYVSHDETPWPLYRAEIVLNPARVTLPLGQNRWVVFCKMGTTGEPVVVMCKTMTRAQAVARIYVETGKIIEGDA